MANRLKIFHLETKFLTIFICFGSLITPYGAGFVNDPRADKIRVMTDLQIFHTVTSVEDPFSDIADARWKTDGSKVHTFKKCTVIQIFQGLRKLQTVHATEIKSFFSDLLQSFRKLYRAELLTLVEGAVFNICQCRRKMQRFQRSTLGKSLRADSGDPGIIWKNNTSKLSVFTESSPGNRGKCL